METTSQRKLAIAGQELRPLGRIGEGTYACVLLASMCKSRSNADGSGTSHSSHSHETTRGLCAIKIFKSKSNEVVRLAKREVLAHTHLNGHPNIVHLRGAYRGCGGRPILLMEYCPRDLQSEIRLHPAGLPSTTVKLLAWQLIQAVHFMHAERFIHRDLKPTNLLLSADGVLKVSDFGLARDAPLRDPRTGTVEEPLTNYVVTRWYRAPEVLLHKPYGTAADIWSVGCTIAEMAMGSPLMPGKSSVDQIFQIWELFGSLAQRDHQQSVAARAAQRRKPSFRDRMGKLFEEQLLDVLEAALRTNPLERATAEDLLRMPYFEEIPDLLVGTTLEGLYNWKNGAVVVAFPTAETSRAISLQAEELDLPSRPMSMVAAPPSPLLVAADAGAPDANPAVCAAAACTAAAAAAAYPSATKLHTPIEGLTSTAAAAAAATAAINGHKPNHRAAGHFRVRGRDDSMRHDYDNDDDDDGGDGGGGGSKLRVEDLKFASTCPRAGSVPARDGQGVDAATARIGLRRTTSVVLSKKGRGNGGGGAGCGAGEDDDGGDGSRGPAGATSISGVRHQLHQRTGGRVSTASLRNLFAQGRVESPLSTWGRSQWELATASGLESEPLQVDLSGTAGGASAPTGRARGISATTTAAIPEDSPFIDPVPGRSSHAPLAAANSFHPLPDMPPPSSPHTFITVAPSGIVQLARRQHRELMEGVLVPTTVASGASGSLNSAAAAIVRPCPSLKSFATSSAIYSSTGVLPPLWQGTSYSHAAAAAAGENIFPTGSGLVEIDGATHVMPYQDIGGNSGPPLSASEMQVSMGSKRALPFVHKIMNNIGMDDGVTLPPSVTVMVSAGGGGTGGGAKAAVVQHCSLAPEPAHELSPKPLDIGEGTKDGFTAMNGKPNSQGCEARTVAVAGAGAAEAAKAAVIWGPTEEAAQLPRTSRSADGKRVLPSEFGQAPGFGENNAADMPMGLDDTWTWNCATGAVSGSRSYGCVTVVEREKAMGFCECGCRCDCRSAVESGLKEHHLSGAPERACIPAEAGMCMWAADSEGQRGSSFGCAVENAVMTGSGCRCKSATGHTSNSFSRRFLQGIRKLVFCGP